MLKNIRIILLKTFHPGNIGSAARAMKTMGLSQLYLVKPQRFPAPEADSMAAGAKDILSKACIVETLDQAIDDCSIIVGTSARSRNPVFSRPTLNAAQCASQLLEYSDKSSVALVFGQETMGLTNCELEKCHYHAYINANPNYPVLNIASAIQVLCYEIFKASEKRQQDYIVQKSKISYPSNNDLEKFYQHLETTLNDINFIINKHPGLVMSRLRRFFNRARPETKELNMLRGILTSTQRSIKNTRNLTYPSGKTTENTNE